MAVSDQKPIAKGQAWFCTTGLPSDVVIEVDDMTFHLHKFPLMSKSRKLHNLITEQEINPTFTTGDQSSSSFAGEVEDDGGDEIVEVQCHIVLPDFPGGSETFETAAKFCYGVKIDVTASNVAPLRCAGEFLEMTEEYSEENLVSKAERFLLQSVLKSLKDSIKALKSCESLMPLAEELGIPQRCVEAAAARASSADPSLFGWPVSDAGDRDSSRQILWNGIDAVGGGRRRKGLSRASNPSESWLEEMSSLSLPLFTRLIAAMRGRDLSSEMIETCLVNYAKKRIPGISRTSRKPSTSSSSSSAVSEGEQRELLETVISNLPTEQNVSPTNHRPSPATTRLLFGLLRTANILGVSAASKALLEKKLGSRLDQATLDDLLIPSYSYLNETLYDVDCVARILGYFLEFNSDEDNSNAIVVRDGGAERIQPPPPLMAVGKLIDGYLSEIASDANLKSDRFFSLAMSLPDRARLFHDGLYRAVDVYLKAHGGVSESERERICGVLDCQKLTLEACTHAAQNERLPLRAVVQVLFFEQLQLRHAIAENLMAVEAAQADPSRPSVLLLRDDVDDDESEESNSLAPATTTTTTAWRTAVRENQVLRLDMDSMRTRVRQLETECSTMRKVIEKIDTTSGGGSDNNDSSNGRGWKESLAMRFGCKFKTQVCDSQQQPSVMDTRKGRRHHHHSNDRHHRQD